MKLTKSKRETVILFDEEEEVVNIYTHNAK